MKIFEAPAYDRFDLFDMNKMAESENRKDFHAYENEKAVDVTISNDGLEALRKKLEEKEPKTNDTILYELTAEDTNEIEMEHYFAMRKMSSLTLKDGNYTLEDVMKSVAETYEMRYNEIVKAHENGNRKVSYDLTGESTLTLDEDLAGLDRAYRRSLADMEGYITCQQTSDGAAFFGRTNTCDDAVRDKKYREAATSMMEQARACFLELRKKPDYDCKDGVAKSVISNIMNDNVLFRNQTQKLFEKTIISFSKQA